MHNKLRVLLSVAGCLLLLALSADGRELASDSNKVRLEISDASQCKPSMDITVTASSADYFDQDALTLQRLADTARAILLFECPQVSTITFTGQTDNVVVFKGTIAKISNWDLETDPTPLEGLALFFGLRNPDFFYLGTLHDQLKPYRNIRGIENTFQYKSYEQQIQRFISIVNGDTKAFQAYLKHPGKKFESFDKALAHYADILSIIKTYAAAQYPTYNQVYTEVSNSLKQEYWSSAIDDILEDDDRPVKDILADADALLKGSSSSEFPDFVDSRVASWLSEEGAFIKSEIADAPLQEIAWTSEYLAGFPEATQATTLPKSRAVIQQLSNDLLALITKRKDDLQALAVKTIQEVGKDHEDVDAILDTGFAIADKFEAAGYVEEGHSVIVASLDHIDHILKSGLQAYKQELKTMTLTSETASALQEQALAFEELSAEIEGFAAYKKAIDDTLKANKGTICESVLKEAHVDKKEYGTLIDLGHGQMTLATLTCELFENQHVVTEFKQADKPDVYVLGIEEADDTQSRFRLKAEQTKQGHKLHVVGRSGSKDSSMSKAEWQDYIAHLLASPPSGKPDAKGIRECDRLAADPADPNKLAPGVDFEKDNNALADIERTIDACIAAVEHNPQDARQQFQLGRLLWYARDEQAAGQYLKLAADGNYAPSLYYQAELLLSSSSDNNSFVDALDLYKAAAKGGYAPGHAKVKELNPDGLDFFREMPPPTSTEMLGAFEETKTSRSFMGITTYAEVLRIDIKECFQTSATDFSCEYKPIAKCGMVDPRGDRVIAFMSKIQQKDCDNIDYQFKTFRKLPSGGWTYLKEQS